MIASTSIMACAIMWASINKQAGAVKAAGFTSITAVPPNTHTRHACEEWLPYSPHKYLLGRAVFRSSQHASVREKLKRFECVETVSRMEK